jgi:hypothetical protein
MKTLFRLSGGNQYQETKATKEKKLKEYKKLLKKNGKEIVSEKEVKHKRFGNLIELEIK